MTGDDIGRDSDDDGLRWYTAVVDGQKVRALSVTTVLSVALEEDMSALESWKDDHDGSGDSYHHEHVYWFSGPRGTLCHYQALSKFEHAFDESDDMWGEEEAESMAKLLHGPKQGTFDDASHDPDDIVYSILKRQGVVESREQYQALFKDNTRLVDIAHENTEWFKEKFDTICDHLGVDDDSIIRVEKFLVNEDTGYGGQTDMVYEDPNGDTVVVDLKTSSSFRHKHRLQSVAYMKAVEQADWGPDEVDRIEVWRIHPDAEEWQVHSHEIPSHAEHLYDEENPDRAKYTDAHFYTDKWGDFSYDSIDDMWEKFQGLCEKARENVE